MMPITQDVIANTTCITAAEMTVSLKSIVSAMIGLTYSFASITLIIGVAIGFISGYLYFKNRDGI